jgi:HAD superfamily hydrolase (TIGR01450 family)
MIRALDVDGVLLDIDGVLSISWAPIPGSIDTMAWLRREGIPYRLITNTTTHTRVDLSATLREAGFDVTPDEIVTAVVATGAYLRAHHAGARVQVLSDGDGHGDLRASTWSVPTSEPTSSCSAARATCSRTPRSTGCSSR